MMKKLLFLIAMFLWVGSSWGQSFAIVGSGTASNGSTVYPAPFGNYWWGARHQFLVTAAQLTAAGIPANSQISSLGFNVTATNGAAPHQDYYVRVYATTATDPISAGWVTTGQVAESTPVNQAISVGWIQTSFNSAFVWNGSDNLVIETCFNNTGYSNNASTQWTTSGLGTGTWSRWYRADASGVCASTLTTSSSTTTRPNIRFGYIPTTPFLTPAPLSLDFGFTAFGDESASQSYELTGDNLTSSPITVTAPVGFEVSLDDINWFDDVQISFTPPTLTSTTVFVRFVPTAPETSYSDDVTNVGGGASADVTVTGHSFAPLSGDYLISAPKFNSATGKEIYFAKQTRLVTKDVLVYSPSKEKKELFAGKTDQAVEYDDQILPYDSDYTWVNQVVEEEYYVPMLNGVEYTGELMAVVSDEKGSKSTFPTITAAVAALNQRGVSGPVRFLLDDASYPSETYPIIIDVQISLPTATNTVTIRPNTSVVATVAGSSPSAAVIQIQNSYIIIDGSNSGGTDRSLTIENTNTTTPQVIRFASVGTTPIVGSQLKNCNIINGANTSTAVVLNALVGADGGYFNDILVQNNSIQKAFIGLHSHAFFAPGNGTGFLVAGNELTGTGPNSIRLAGLYAQGFDGATLTNNTISFANVGDASNVTGIWFATNTRNSIISDNIIGPISGTAFGPRGIFVSSGLNASVGVDHNSISGITTPSTAIPIGIGVIAATLGVDIHNNEISNIKNTNTGGYAAIGISLNSTSTTANIRVFNNLVHDVAGHGDGSFTNWNGYGINILTGGGYKLYYNSVNLATNQTLATGNPACLIVSSSVTTASSLDIRNNIFSIPATVGTNRFAVISNAANTVFEYIDYNDYYSSGSNIGRIGGIIRADITEWRTGTGQDLNSKDDNPQFVSNTYLRPLGGSPVLGAGDNSTGIATDYDGVTRDANNPTIGAYELPEVSPVLSVVPDNLGFGYVASGGTSAELSYQLTGNFLSPATGDITVTPPANFEISLTSGSGYSSSAIDIPYTGGTLSQTIYVIFKPTGSPADYNDVINNSGGGASAVDVTVTGTSILSWCAFAGADCSDGDAVHNFSTSGAVADITNNSSGCSNDGPNGYGDFTHLELVVEPGSSFDISVQVQSTWSNGFAIFIDWYQTGTLTEVWNSGTWGTGVFTGTINVPAGAVPGATLMRVMAGWNCVPSDPCATCSSYGEAEDYTVIVSPAAAVWTGAIDEDWFDAGNWDTYVPGPNTDVTIPAGLTNYPTILSDPAYCNDIFFGSAAGSTATLLDNGLLTVNGTATVERYFSGNDIDWHLVSSPVSNALADVFMGMYLQSFDETTNSYTEITDETTPLGVMDGYGLYSTLGAANTVAFNGNLNFGNQSRGFTAVDEGWNLMGNPFTSSIDWEMVTIPGNMSNEVHYIEAATGNDLSYVKGTGGSGAQYIPPMQGFFVSATGSGTLSVGNAQRSHMGSGIFYKSNNPNLVVLQASNGIFSDEVWIHFNEEAGVEHDGKFDAYKRISLSNPMLPQIFSYTPAGVKLSVNGMPEVQSVPVGFTAVQSGAFTISTKETGDFSELYLEDLFTGTATSLLADNYTFNYNAGDNMSRFVLHFAPLSVGDNVARNVNIWSYGNEVIVMVPELTNGHVKVYNMMGQEVVSSTVTSGRNVITVPQAGNYVVALISNEVTITEKVVIK